MKQSLLGGSYVEAIPKKTRQGRGKHSKYSAQAEMEQKSVIVDKGDKYNCIKS